MPDLLSRSLEDMLAAMAARFGTQWPNPWWPSGNAAYDDCAAAVSYFLFGLNSARNPYYSYVSQLQNHFASQDRRAWGNAGIRRGDILAFSWTKDPNSFDHTEIALGPVSPAGLITSRGTNSNPGDDMRDRTRSASYVVSYSRPAYPGTTTAGSGGDMILTPEDDMPTMSEFLNTPAFTGGPTISQMFKDNYYANFYGSDAMKDGKRSFSQSLADIAGILRQMVSRDGKNITQIQDNADTGTYVRAILDAVKAQGASAPIDYAALAAAIVAKMGTPTGTPTLDEIQAAAEAGLRAVFADAAAK